MFLPKALPDFADRIFISLWWTSGVQVERFITMNRLAG